MTCKLFLAEAKVEALKAEFGDDNIVTLNEANDQGYMYVQFEVKDDYDVLKVMHAGTTAGLHMGLYGSGGKKKVSVTVA